MEVRPIKTYRVKGMAQAFKLVYGVVIGFGSSFLLFYLVFNSIFLGFITVFTFLIATLFLLGSLALLLAYEAIDVCFDDQSWVQYTNLFGLRLGEKKAQAEYLQYVLLSEIAYQDRSTPLDADDVYYVVYLIYDGDKKVCLFESLDKDKAMQRLKEVAQLAGIDFKVADHVD